MATIFLSDVDVGGRHDNNYTLLLDYLRQYIKETDKIVIVGDLLNLQDAPMGEVLSVAQDILKFLFKDCRSKLHYIIGDKDNDMIFLKDIFPIVHSALTFPIANKKAICLHGHLLTPTVDTSSGFFHQLYKRLCPEQESVYEANIVTVFKDKFDYVITGHTFSPTIKDLGGITYINVGDVVVNKTLLIARANGFELISYVTGEVVASAGV